MALPRKHKKTWTANEVTQLKDLYRKKVLHRDIASRLKRTLNAVESKAMELGLSGKRRLKRALK